MEILLLILKIIGIVLLVLLAFLLLLVLIVLFVPIRYQVAAGYYEKNPDVSVKVSWLLYILHISLRITKEDKNCIIRIFGIPIMDIFHPKPKKEKKAKTKSRAKKEKVKKSKDNKTKNNETEKTIAASGSAEYSLTEEIPQTEIRPDSDVKENTSFRGSDESQENESQPDKKGIFEKISEFTEKMAKGAASVPDKIKEAGEKGVDAKTQAEKWITVLKRDKTKKAIECAKDLLIWLLKKLLPRKWKGYLHFGFKDPATTAQILGYYWMFIGILTDRLVCQPEFEKEIIEGDIKIRGHLRGITFVTVGWKVLFDPKLKYLRKIKAEVDAL